MVTLQLNGEARDFPDELTVAELVSALKIETPAIAIEVNRVMVPRSEHRQRRLMDGDEVEIVTFVGGG